MTLPLTGLLEIRCPRCGGRASFDEAFEFIPGQRVAGGGATGLHRWGGWFVRERYPSVTRWKPPSGSHQYLYHGSGRPSGGYRLRHRGVMRCSGCHRVDVHLLRWPGDAWFLWNVRGTPLWAWDAAHGRVLLHYLESRLRDPTRYPGHRKSLQELPAAVLAPRNRPVIARKIRATLRASGEREEL